MVKKTLEAFVHEFQCRLQMMRQAIGIVYKMQDIYKRHVYDNIFPMSKTNFPFPATCVRGLHCLRKQETTRIPIWTRIHWSTIG